MLLRHHRRAYPNGRRIALVGCRATGGPLALHDVRVCVWRLARHLKPAGAVTQHAPRRALIGRSIRLRRAAPAQATPHPHGGGGRGGAVESIGRSAPVRTRSAPHWAAAACVRCCQRTVICSAPLHQAAAMTTQRTFIHLYNPLRQTLARSPRLIDRPRLSITTPQGGSRAAAAGSDAGLHTPHLGPSVAIDHPLRLRTH